MGRPKISFTGAGLRVARVRFNSRPILATFLRIAIIEAALATLKLVNICT